MSHAQGQGERNAPYPSKAAPQGVRYINSNETSPENWVNDVDENIFPVSMTYCGGRMLGDLRSNLQMCGSLILFVFEVADASYRTAEEKMANFDFYTYCHLFHCYFFIFLIFCSLYLVL